MAIFTTWRSTVEIVARDQDYETNGIVRVRYVDPDMDLPDRWTRIAALAADKGIAEIEKAALAAEVRKSPIR